MTDQVVRALPAPDFQVVHVTVRDGYRPRTIIARAGVPLRLVFHRDEDAACSERVIFSSPHLDRHLAPHGATVVELPAQEPGEVRFTCAMGRYRGRIRLSELKPARDATQASWASRRRAGVAASVLVMLIAALLIVILPALGATPLIVGLPLALLTMALTLGSWTPQPYAGSQQPPRGQ